MLKTVGKQKHASLLEPIELTSKMDKKYIPLEVCHSLDAFFLLSMTKAEAPAIYHKLALTTFSS